MLEISRSLYRQLASRLLPESAAAGRDRRRRTLLTAIETNLDRMVAEPDFDRPARRLYLDVRTQFPLLELPRVREVIERHVLLAETRAVQARAERFAADRTCRALVRAGGPCSRQAITGLHFCPSHRHLEELADQALAVAA
jgi:hypothetical protein